MYVRVAPRPPTLTNDCVRLHKIIRNVDDLSAAVGMRDDVPALMQSIQEVSIWDLPNLVLEAHVDCITRNSKKSSQTRTPIGHFEGDSTRSTPRPGSSLHLQTVSLC
jgi:hypothetical protein